MRGKKSHRQVFAFYLLVLSTPALLCSCATDTPRDTGGVDQAGTNQNGAIQSETTVLENVHALTNGLISGGEPTGDAGFAALKRLGVRSLISTDAVAPDLARAEAAGIRVVHLPIGYDGITDERRVQLAAAIRDLPKPIYIHCHHGKHRGPAAACVGAVGAGLIPVDEGLAFMEQAGTSRSYPGLWRDAGDAEPLPSSDLNGLADRLPESDIPHGTPNAMAMIDRAHERLWLVADNEWVVPSEHPDLAPASDAGLIRDLLRSLRTDSDSLIYGADYIDQMAGAAEHAASLESLIISDKDPAALQLSLDALLNSCIACHTAYRN